MIPSNIHTPAHHSKHVKHNRKSHVHQHNILPSTAVAMQDGNSQVALQVHVMLYLVVGRPVVALLLLRLADAGLVLVLLRGVLWEGAALLCLNRARPSPAARTVTPATTAATRGVLDFLAGLGAGVVLGKRGVGGGLGRAWTGAVAGIACKQHSCVGLYAPADTNQGFASQTAHTLHACSTRIRFNPPLCHQ